MGIAKTKPTEDKVLNPFSQFDANATRTEFIKALGASVTYRMLTMAENDAFTKRMIKEYKTGQAADIDMEQLSMITYEKVALCLVEPKMSADELKALGVDAGPAITEILKLVGGTPDIPMDEEGNSQD
jgi:hypothetical protein